MNSHAVADAAQGILEFVAGIASVREHMTQPREAADDFGEHQRRPITVLDVGGVDHGVDEIAFGIGQNVALATLGLLACVVTTMVAAFRRSHALAVDHPGTGRCLATLRLSCHHQQGVVDRQPQPVVAPKVDSHQHGPRLLSLHEG